MGYTQDELSDMDKAAISGGKMFTDEMIARCMEQPIAKDGTRLVNVGHGLTINIKVNDRTANDIKEWKAAIDRVEGEVTPGMFDGLISYDCNGKPRPSNGAPTRDSAPPDAHVQCGRPIDNPYAGKSNPIEFALSETTEAAMMEDMKMKGEWKNAVQAGYKPIELEDILHERGSVPHFMGNPVASWQDVERIEEACRKSAVSARMSYHEVCNAAAGVLSNTHRTEAQPDRIGAAIKELANAVQVAQEKSNFEGKISARQARRSAQPEKFTQQLKKSFNEQKRK